MERDPTTIMVNNAVIVDETFTVMWFLPEIVIAFFTATGPENRTVLFRSGLHQQPRIYLCSIFISGFHHCCVPDRPLCACVCVRRLLIDPGLFRGMSVLNALAVSI